MVFIHDLFCCVLKFEGNKSVKNKKGRISHEFLKVEAEHS